jgi:hypothetical protein
MGRRSSSSVGALAAAAAGTWDRFWFTPTTAGRLAVVRVLAGLLGLLLAWSWAGDLVVWFGPDGIVSPEVLGAWRSPTALSLFDVARSNGALWALFLLGVGLLGMLAVGAWTPIAAPLAALFWASLLHRGPMLVGPADDVLAVILWCLVVGRSGDAFSVDRRLALADARPSWRNGLALALLRLHASVIAAAAVVAQLKADVWWNGTAAWWLAARESTRVDLTGVFAGSEIATNLVTHAIVLFEIAFAAGVWSRSTQSLVARAGLVGWPLIGLIAGEPMWGAAMAILALACLPDDSAARTAGRPL